MTDTVTVTRFETASGSTYEINATPGRAHYVRRTNPDAAKRGDDKWIRLLNTSVLIEGYPFLMELSSLAEYGPDDEGNTNYATTTTHRTTSVVTKITEETA